MMHGFYPLFYKEIMRFYKVSVQTVLAPVVTALLYFAIFAHILKNQAHLSHGLNYSAFLIPGLMMMSMVQNAFANASSSLILSKVTGNIVFILIPPISTAAFFSAYTLASVVRGMVVGLGVFICTLPITHVSVAHPLWALLFAFLACSTLGVLGLIAGIWAEKFDELAVFSNFIIMPLSMLSGVFYSTHALPEFWQMMARLNPFFYMIDGFRYGFFGVSDIAPATSASINFIALLIVSMIAYTMLKTGYKLKH